MPSPLGVRGEILCGYVQEKPGISEGRSYGFIYCSVWSLFSLMVILKTGFRFFHVDPRRDVSIAHAGVEGSETFVAK